MKKLLKKAVMFLAAVSPVFWAPQSVLGHGALEFIDTESYSSNAEGETTFHLHYDYMVEDENDPLMDHYEITPGICYGITGRLMFDVHTHFAKFGNGHVVAASSSSYGPGGPSPFMEAVAVSLHYRITEDAPVDVALCVTGEIPSKRAVDLLGSEQAVKGTLILNREIGEHRIICLNLSATAEGSSTAQEFSLGLKTPLTDDPHNASAGLEISGDLSDLSGSVKVLPGIYMPLSEEGTILKTGLQLGKEMQSLRFNMTLMHTF